MIRVFLFGIAVMLALGLTPSQAKCKGCNGCTIVRKVTVFSPTNPGPASTVPDEGMATVERLDGSTWTPLASTPLDSAGRFSFANLPAGSYRICGAGPQGACYAGTTQSPVRVGQSGASVTATCPAPAGDSSPTAIMSVMPGPGTLTGSCPACGKSVASGTNNAR